jgi:cyclic pyranopterin phosphate synthase
MPEICSGRIRNPAGDIGDMKKLSHIDDRGGAKMVDIGGKSATQRMARARGSVLMSRETIDLIEGDGIAKGNVLDTARLAGIMAAKKTCELVPLCHQINLSSISIDFTVDRKKNKIDIEARAECIGRTGVEMESLTAVSVAALTVYDMCKAVDRVMVISEIMLLEKKGGKSGTWKRK